jgi:LmbE family N-acetylglucosaminyl deacetylase
MATIVPLTSEAAWLPAFQGLADWKLPLVRTLVLAPHPDDETLGAGGLITKLCWAGVPVTIVAVTDGEGAYADIPQLGDIRIVEQTEALRRLGVPECRIHRLHLPDRDLSRYEDELVDLALPLAKGNMHLVAPWPRDFHPDHEAVGRAAARVSQLENLTITYYLFWTWHRGEPSMLDGLSVVKLALSDSELKSKLHALQAHVSQFEHGDGQPILSPELLAPAQRAFEVYVR